jgi:hypothetical protein
LVAPVSRWPRIFQESSHVASDAAASVQRRVTPLSPTAASMNVTDGSARTNRNRRRVPGAGPRGSSTIAPPKLPVRTVLEGVM